MPESSGRGSGIPEVDMRAGARTVRTKPPPKRRPVPQADRGVLLAERGPQKVGRSFAPSKICGKREDSHLLNNQHVNGWGCI